MNRSGTQRFRLALTRGPVAAVSGELYFQSYLLMKQMDESLFMHANSFREQYTPLVLQSRSGRRLDIDVTPADALAERRWDAEAGALRLTLNHFHGVARVTVTGENRQ